MRQLLMTYLLCFITTLTFGQDCSNDTIPPEIECYTGTATVILDSLNSASFLLKDILTNVQDDCSVPVLTSDLPTNGGTAYIDCDQRGEHSYHIYATDASGNTSSCVATILVQEMTSFCLSVAGTYEITGTIQARTGENFPVKFDIKWFRDGEIIDLKPIGVTVLKDGRFGIDLFETRNEIPYSGFIRIKPVFDARHIMISYLDIQKIIKHILGIAPLENELANIAADVNQDGIISALDVANIRKHLDGVKLLNPAFLIEPYAHRIPMNNLPAPHIQFEIMPLGNVSIWDH